MVSNVLLRLKPELALTLDADNYACGTYVGYGFTLRALNDKNCIIFNSWARKSALTTKTVDDFFKEYMSKPENSFVKAYKAGEPNISAVLFAGNDDAQAVLDIKRFITDMVKYYSANYYSNACAKCNSSIGLSFAKAADGNVKQLCKMCVQSEEDAAEKADMAQSTKPIDSQPVPQPMQQPVPQPMQQPAPQPMQQPAVNQTQQTANSAVGIYGIPVPATQPIADDQVVVTPTTVLPPATSNNSMDSVDPATAPESTGYSTAQSLAELKPPSNSNLPPISGGFSQPAYSPMNSNGGFVQQPMNNGGFVQRPMNSFGNDGRFVAGRPTAISQPANPVMGILGAIIFSLIGCAVWIIIGKLGYISYLGGIAMAFSTIFGYHLFGKKFDTLGLIISIVIVLVMVLVSNMFIYTWELLSQPGMEEALSLLGYNGFFGVFFGLFDLMKQVDLHTGLDGIDSMTGGFISDLIFSYIISMIATVAIGVSMLKKDR
ncbi:hypothetical protein EUBSIR_00966 [[Eubacterium] siraeum DSM 15702]|uniref:Uncharacterized protein n=1 Tax=[Eubacterium] siraeum DSM 15702 TaxID=428128 RepID=B0MMA5_9FIRM|nr:hypothetical protein EUBSIR_00966 [[Eubacterium] siraeum DSM 15702]UWP24370.1 hypothetical protein NQ549_07395 [[Eubacterium] siraeum]